MATFLGTKIHIHQLKWQPSELLACNYRNRGFFFNPHFLAQSWPPHKLMDGRWLSKYQTRWNCMLPLWNGSLAPRAHWKRVHLDHNSIEAHFNKVFFHSHYGGSLVITITGRRFLLGSFYFLFFVASFGESLLLKWSCSELGLLKCFTAKYRRTVCTYRPGEVGIT